MISRFHNNVATLPAPPVRAYVPHLAMGVVLRPVPARFGPGRRLLNLSALCVDRHLGDHADRIAVLGHEAVSYRELHERVCRLANALKDQGVQRGDTVAITLPLGVDSIVAVLACIRIGAVHLVMAGGLDAHAMAARLVDCRAVAVLAGGETDHDTTTASLKSTLDRALATAGSRSGVRLMLVVAAPDVDVPMKPGRDHRYDAVVDWYEPDCPPEAMYADDPVFRLYRAGQSGSTCSATHTAGEYSRLLSYTMDMLSPQEDDGLPCSILNMAWQTGQTALVVGVLANGGTIALV